MKLPMRLIKCIRYGLTVQQRMVSIPTDLCLNLNGLSLSFNEIPGPDLTRLYLVDSGILYHGFKGKGWPKMIYQWRLQNILKMVIVPITLFNRYQSRSDFTEHPKQNNKDLTPDLGGQSIPANFGQGLLGFLLSHNIFFFCSNLHHHRQEEERDPK
jgi:hypothetical protein